MQRSDPVERDEALIDPPEGDSEADEASPTVAPAEDAAEGSTANLPEPASAPEDQQGAPDEVETPESDAPDAAPTDSPSDETVAALVEAPAPEAVETAPEPEPVEAVAVVEADAVDEAERPEPAWRRGVIVTAPAVVLTLLVTGGFLMFLLVEPSPRWVVLFGSVVVALSMDGVLRAARREAFEAGGLDTTVYLLLPALYALAAPVFLEHNVRGYWVLPAGMLAGIGFGVLAVGQVSSVRAYDLGRPFGRYVAATATYFVAFALFSLMYTFDLGVRPATIATGLVAGLLAAEMLRDGEIDQLETLVFSAVTGLVIAEVRLTMHYLPIDGHLAALTLLLAFYFVTGLIHAHVTRQLDRNAALEYVTIAVTGLVLVVGAQAAGIA